MRYLSLMSKMPRGTKSKQSESFSRALFSKLSRDWKHMALILLAGLLAGRTLLQPGYFNMHDDLQMLRQRAMEECFLDLQIPCRWTPHMGYGFGFPLFNYYPPLPYLIGETFRVLSFSYVDTVKLTFLLSFLFSGLTMYVLVREFFGRLGGVLSAVFYIWAPYHSVDIFVRGAMNEAWALVFFPLILWSAYKLINTAQFRYIVILALAFTALFTSHNLMVLIFTPLFSGWVLLWLMRARSWFTIPQLLISGVWSFGLAAFFSLPVFFEQKYVHVETLVQGYYEYIAHFASIRQLLFSRFWDYGPSVWMAEDDRMSFQVGHFHWVLPILIVMFILWKYYKTRRVDNLLLVTCYFFLAGWFATFLAHSKSIQIWLELERFLKFVQFPWRFLTLAILSFSIVVGAMVPLLAKRKTRLGVWVVFLLSAGLIAFNFEYFKPERVGPVTDQEKFSGVAWDMQQTAGIYDYLPVSASTAPKSPQKGVVKITEGSGEITKQNQKTNFASFSAKIKSDKAKVEIGIFQFPGWVVFVDGNKAEAYVGDDEWGRMHIDLPKGEHEVVLRLENTPVRTAGNTISLVSWLALIAVPFWRKKIS